MSERREQDTPRVPPQPDGAKALIEGGELGDILVCRKGRSLPMLGAAGKARELALLPPQGEPSPGGPQTVLPVLIGSGTGAALEELAMRLEKAHGANFILLVADRESDIQSASGVRERFARYPGIFWIDGGDTESAINALTAFQIRHGGMPFLPLLNPFYLRLDREWYAALRDACESSAKNDFWTQARYPKFRTAMPRILLLTSKYFLMGEILSAAARLEIPHHLLQVPESEFGRGEFIEQLLSSVIRFKPDFVFTINHLGIDREGVLTDLLAQLRLPLASWFVDNPHLVLSLYSRLTSPWLSIFTWDADNIASLKAQGFEEVHYLPLGVDATRFHPPLPGRAKRPAGLPEAWDGKVAFVGNSMVHKVAQRMRSVPLPERLTNGYQEVAAGFSQSDERSVNDYLTAFHPELLSLFNALPDMESRLGYETMLTWEATLQYRLSCIKGILPFAPLIVGDDGWLQLLDGPQPWHYRGALNYYDELPGFYPAAELNFNCTSKQMKGAVNQRVFDVPATGAFLLTDYREQVENLFEPGREIICYHSPEEATALAREYLARPADRRAVAAAARRRILEEHTYDVRLRSLIARMKDIYG